MTKGLTVKPGWKTYAIGRHLLDVPVDAKLIAQWKFIRQPFEAFLIRDQADFERIVSKREAELRAMKHETRGSMFIERISHPGGNEMLISQADSGFEIQHRYECYFRAEKKAIKYSGDFDPSKRRVVVENFQSMQDWRVVSPGIIPTEIGFVAGEMLLVDKDFNYESWSLVIQLADKPDASLEVSSFVIGKVEQTLRQRAGGIVTGMLGMAIGLSRLRNRERPVGPIWAEEILVAGTQNGKRGYGFKWEAPGKSQSLSEPQLNVELEVSESAYKTNAQSFKNDDEALELWDTLIDSIRLRPGAV
ncbi:T6SS immunity protein Tli4 family protein [Uliginosibacterium sediminicola]|uniref:T6SS immunity protein Tli4 family protein n=1 Tax=Uliginosibacterium sediminicola TaxID=2024550 RepID=A0ABU9Z103_9RHOO